MALLKHTEFMLICDNCYSLIHDYIPAKTKRSAVKQFKTKYNIKQNGVCYCDDCKKLKNNERI